MKLVVSDLSNIEGRILAYLAGEEWKLDAFRAYDAGNGPDLYNITATGIIGGDPYAVTKKNRNIFGKVPDLALGFEGGAGALQTFAKAYGVLMADQWPTIQENIAPEHIEQAKYNMTTPWGVQSLLGLGIQPDEWIASETVKLAWRARHPATKALWYDVKDAAIGAIKSPGCPFQAGQHLTFQTVQHVSGNWLVCKLPSGKFLTYFDPQLTADGGISYMGMGNEIKGGPRMWTALYTYGGKLVENATQAVAGDVLKSTMPAIEAAGYEIVLTVHDEDVTQTPDDPRFNADALSQILATPPTWAPTLPLSAAGFESYRYKKED